MLLPTAAVRFLNTQASLTPVVNQTTALAPASAIVAQLLVDGHDDGGFAVRNFTWADAAGMPRTAALVRNDAVDPAGFWGGYMRSLHYEVDGQIRTCSSNIGDQPGFGYTVNHYIYNNTYPSLSSRFFKGVGDATTFSGRHHTQHQFNYTYLVGNEPLSTTIEWLFVSGRSHPIWSVTFDTSLAAPNSINADTRAPYGEFDYDGGTDSAVAGIGWGDRYKFATLGNVVGVNTSWTYNVPNTVPYVHSFTSSPDAEMGLVQTQTFAQHDAGGYDGYRYWNKTAPNGPMPKDSDWPYQLIQYELPYSNASKRMAWGANYGAVGQDPYLALDHMTPLSGSPYQSYAVHIVLGKHSSMSVAQQVAEVETVQNAHLVALGGVDISRSLPAGVGRTDVQLTKPPGYDSRYATWNLLTNLSQSTLRWSLGVTEGALLRPSFVVHNWTTAAPLSVTLGGALLPSDSLQGYMASVDSKSSRLWLTLGPSIHPNNPAIIEVTAPRNDTQTSGAAVGARRPARSEKLLLLAAGGLSAAALSL